MGRNWAELTVTKPSGTVTGDRKKKLASASHSVTIPEVFAKANSAQSPPFQIRTQSWTRLKPNSERLNSCFIRQPSTITLNDIVLSKKRCFIPFTLNPGFIKPFIPSYVCCNEWSELEVSFCLADTAGQHIRAHYVFESGARWRPRSLCPPVSGCLQFLLQLLQFWIRGNFYKVGDLKWIIVSYQK